MKLNEAISALSATNDVGACAFKGIGEVARVELMEQGLNVYLGKVRDVVDLGNELALVHSDRLSAFDRAIALVPYRGAILCQLTSQWLKYLANKGIPCSRHRMVHDRILVVDKCVPFKIEVVVRGYLAGSVLRSYISKSGQQSAILPPNLRPFEKLTTPIITPTTKAPVYQHDLDISETELVNEGLASSAEWDQIRKIALKAFEIGQEYCAQRGWILVDTKFEFGRNTSGDIVIIDEVLTPDSSRFWVSSSYVERFSKGLEPQMFDKEFVRDWLLRQGFSGSGDAPKVPVSILLELAMRYSRVASDLFSEPFVEPVSSTMQVLHSRNFG